MEATPHSTILQMVATGYSSPDLVKYALPFNSVSPRSTASHAAARDRVLREDGVRIRDLGGDAKTRQFTKAVIARLR